MPHWIPHWIHSYNSRTPCHPHLLSSLKHLQLVHDAHCFAICRENLDRYDVDGRPPRCVASLSHFSYRRNGKIMENQPWKAIPKWHPRSKTEPKNGGSHLMQPSFGCINPNFCDFLGLPCDTHTQTFNAWRSLIRWSQETLTENRFHVGWVPSLHWSNYRISTCGSLLVFKSQ